VSDYIPKLIVVWLIILRDGLQSLDQWNSAFGNPTGGKVTYFYAT
jgi:hypothetical protein